MERHGKNTGTYTEDAAARGSEADGRGWRTLGEAGMAAALCGLHRHGCTVAGDGCCLNCRFMPMTWQERMITARLRNRMASRWKVSECGEWNFMNDQRLW